jgi:hypothetical protein
MKMKKKNLNGIYILIYMQIRQEIMINKSLKYIRYDIYTYIISISMV